MKIYDDKPAIEWVYVAQNSSTHVLSNRNMPNLQNCGDIQMIGHKYYHNLHHFSYLGPLMTTT